MVAAHDLLGYRDCFMITFGRFALRERRDATQSGRTPRQLRAGKSNETHAQQVFNSRHRRGVFRGPLVVSEHFNEGLPIIPVGFVNYSSCGFLLLPAGARGNG